ncbi:12274_t:CDS:2 [Ambispora gerdemannii]|uniref:12274_t:CDS:1 n=1 Tax=Ambispora gerdemannii TaxID=144530 RepID=A0A9N8ZLK2_9GLOM|nr:12274_t:CDS:2 [Ambispora gerdemannii]
MSEISTASLRSCAPNERVYKVVCRANKHFENKNYRCAIEEYTKALTLSQPDLDPSKSTDFAALLFGNRSACYFAYKLYIDAEKDTRQMIRLRPEWSKGYFRRADILLELGRFDDALEDYKEARLRDPSNPKIPLRIAHALIMKDDQEMGVAICQLIPGRDICLMTTTVNPVQQKIFSIAIEIKNIIYVIADIASRNCVVIDACWDVNGILKFIETKKWKLMGAIVTHYHFDHVGGPPPPPYNHIPIKISGLFDLTKQVSNLKVYVNPLDIPYLLSANPALKSYTDRIIHTHGQHRESLGEKTILRFIHVPGHTEGSQAILVNGCRLITGDTLMCGCMGRVDLPGGNLSEIKITLRERLGKLEDGVVVLPGHDYGGKWTTIGMERERGIIGHFGKKKASID